MRADRKGHWIEKVLIERKYQDSALTRLLPHSGILDRREAYVLDLPCVIPLQLPDFSTQTNREVLVTQKVKLRLLRPTRG
jgi:hypothetical protein